MCNFPNGSVLPTATFKDGVQNLILDNALVNNSDAELGFFLDPAADGGGGGGALNIDVFSFSSSKIEC